MFKKTTINSKYDVNITITIIIVKIIISIYSKIKNKIFLMVIKKIF